jgi:hypothetical protein
VASLIDPMRAAQVNRAVGDAHMHARGIRQ